MHPAAFRLSSKIHWFAQQTWTLTNILHCVMHYFSDVDECSSANVCDADINAQCVNTIGSYNCECPIGFAWNVTTCEGKWNQTYLD